MAEPELHLRRPRYGAEGVQPYWLRELCCVCPMWADVTIDDVPLCGRHAHRQALALADDDDRPIEGRLFPWTEDEQR
jgi:hypothetical protein